MHPIFFFIIDSVFTDSICFYSIVGSFVFFFDFPFNIFLLEISFSVALSVEVEEEDEEDGDVGADEVCEAGGVLAARGEVRPGTICEHQNKLDLQATTNELRLNY